MKFAPYWARGKHGGFTCWRWSFTSREDAAALAAEAARRLAARFAAGDRSNLRYGYADRPLREPVLEEIRSPAGTLEAAITRNAYGCDVLNTARAMFVDIDLPEPAKPRGGGFLASLFGRPAPPRADPADAALEQLRAWTRAHPGSSWRIYRTFAGLRLLATHAPFDPATTAADAVLGELGADPLYRRLCTLQECFRARLNPKPWRCGCTALAVAWPFASDDDERRFREWETAYARAASGFATCQLLDSLGGTAVHPELAALVALHDRRTGAQSGRPLA